MKVIYNLFDFGLVCCKCTQHEVRAHFVSTKLNGRFGPSRSAAKTLVVAIFCLSVRPLGQIVLEDTNNKGGFYVE